jgi:hypothetical protein
MSLLAFQSGEHSPNGPTVCRCFEAFHPKTQAGLLAYDDIWPQGFDISAMQAK